MSKATYGTTPVVLGESTYTLVPNLAAVNKIEARFGGLRGAMETCQQMSVNGVAAIIAAGANVSPREAEQIAQKVFDTGVGEAMVQILPYVQALLNPAQVKVEADEADAGNA